MADLAHGDCAVEEMPFGWLVESGPELRELLDSEVEPTPFQTAPWLASWWAAFGRRYDPHVLTVRRGGQLVAVLPLMRARDGKLPVLEWLGAGRSDHAPLLLRPDPGEGWFEAVLAHLRQTQIRWWLLSLRTLQDRQLREMAASLRSGSYRVAADDVSPRVAIHGSWADYLGEKSRKHRKNIKRLLSQASDILGVEAGCIRDFTPTLLAEITEVERRSWKAQSGSLRMEGAGERLYSEFLLRFSEMGQLEVWFCRFKGVLLAYLITFTLREAAFYYNGAFRSDYAAFHPDLTPGSLLIATALKNAHDRGLKAFDFLRGDEPYKRLWANEERPLHHLVVRAPGGAGLVAELGLVRLRWFLRRYAFAHRIRRALRPRGTP
jgi:CelD/BcsL family acetyltransferase involved in cellulose biosynthesis